MINRRRMVVSALAGGALIGSRADAVAKRPARPTWVSLRPTENGYSITVNDEQVDLGGLDAAVLAHAATANFGMLEAQVRREVRIYVRSEPGVPYGAILEVVRHLRFERVGLVGESRER